MLSSLLRHCDERMQADARRCRESMVEVCARCRMVQVAGRASHSVNARSNLKQIPAHTRDIGRHV